MAKAVFIDRDGTINKEVNYLFKPSDFEFIPGAADAIKVFHDLGYLVIVITNQAGVAKGYYTEDDVKTLHCYIDEQLSKSDTYIDAYYYCPHHPEGVIPEYKTVCDCRKPAIGMIIKAKNDFYDKGIDILLSESIMIGDKELDVEAGKNSGIGKCILVRSGHDFMLKNSGADEFYNSIFEYAQIIQI